MKERHQSLTPSLKLETEKQEEDINRKLASKKTKNISGMNVKSKDAQKRVNMPRRTSGIEDEETMI